MGMRTRPVNKYLYKNCLKKAEEFMESAKGAFLKSHWNSAVTNAVHSAISSSDALLVFFKELRSAGESHDEILILLSGLDIDKEELKKKTQQFQRLAQIKNSAEYEEKLMSQQDAENSLRDAERFLEWVKGKLPP
ncbi:MAG: HEPN domain-containing protein [Candidatus Aenigmarchaeota archaeon]|nr:HEPN domain-containing protein [Candidatus Aenigmarchaeota archaeon]